MFTALAKFIMRGRLQAAVLVLLSIPVLSHAVISLVCLRRGIREGLLMVLIGLSPVLLYWVLGHSNEQALLAKLFVLAAVLLPAMCLRATVSWSFTLIACVTFTVAGVLLIASMAEGLLAGFGEAIAEFVERFQTTNPEATDKLPDSTSFAAMSGFLALSVLISSLTGLVAGRWLQSLLYNPEGFGKEFRELRLGFLPSVICLIFSVMFLLQGPDYGFWAIVFTLPLLLVAVSLAHYLAQGRELGLASLIVFYVLIFSPVLLVLAFIGFIDSWLNIRNHFSAPNKR
ncbi:MAG: hypothetical protein ACRBCI_13885 [Cellvibrionaceae bacterium]